ncbi:MAG TPA: AAA family ATPase [Candidatus Dormibacteraeota bacterium]|nr:AAA family ATPase [Candidatus Dormibacteraeota bacterium]
METPLQEFLLERLVAEGKDPVTQTLVLAAVAGPEPLARALEGEAGTDAQPPGAASLPAQPVRAYLQEISVEGFRGIGPRATLRLEPGPGLTLVVGRNGSGKSSFAEALEVLLTGHSLRWAERSAAWKEGWRNLHRQGRVEVEARFTAEGTRGVTIRRHWAEGVTKVEQGEIEVQEHGRPRSGLDALGWDRALQAHRPFLSYNELGSMFDEPSDLYDALSSVLGLDDLVRAGKWLADARRDRERSIKAAAQRLDQLRPRLEELDDERARRCLAALAGKAWDLSALERALPGSSADGDEAGVEMILHQLAAMTWPSVDQVLEVAERLRQAAAARAATAGTDAERASRLADLLQRALDLHAAHGDEDCPVCGRPGALSADWRAAAEAQVRDLQERAQAVTEAERQAERARREAEGLLAGPPAPLSKAASVGVDVASVLTAWSAWAAAPLQNLEATADHLLTSFEPLEKALRATRQAAQAELDRRESAWRPLACDLAEWLGQARNAQQGQKMLPHLKAAEQWLKDVSEELRGRRFEPIATRARAMWEQLRHRSGMELIQPVLEGQTTHRRVRLEVRVDGQEATAVGVMSQGELHCLALALFLPRALLPDSPFGFVVIDDPVQSMDPARVDGLARVLEETAKHRQVVVFTHDDRLSEAVRRLRVQARILEVTRRPGSQVEVKEQLEPVARLLEDAKVVALEEALPAEVAARVVPGLCRQALEAACAEVVRRRRIARGDPHAEVDAELERASKTINRMALALFDDRNRAGDVYTTLNRRFGAWASDLLTALNRATHRGGNSVMGLIQATERLVGRIRALA